MSHFDKQLREALDDIPEVPDEEPAWGDIEHQIYDLESRDPGIERILLYSEDKYGILVYAKKFFEGVGWPEAEPILAQDDWYAYGYATEVLQDRFPQGEEAISQDASLSYHYAIKILGGRFPKGEEVISKSGRYSYLYARFALGGRRFPKGEEAISKRAEYSFLYAVGVLHRRFPEGEMAIRSKPGLAKRYFETFGPDGPTSL